MSIFDFVSVMFSIIVGLSFAQLVGGIAGLFRSEARTTPYAPVVLWVCMLIFTHFLLWWSFWDYREVEWNFLRFLVGSGQAVILLLLSELILPRKADGPSIDLEQHFFRVRPILMGAYSVLVIIFIIDGPFVFRSESFWNIYRIPQSVLLGAALTGLVVKKSAPHVAISAVLLAALVFGSGFRFLPGGVGILD